jgi:hypothetical protein
MFVLQLAAEKYPNIPVATLEGLERYVRTGCPTGSFLRAVLSHELFEAVSRADNNNQRSLVDLVKLIYNDCPIGCHGSEAKVDLWTSLGGMDGLEKVA